MAPGIEHAAVDQADRRGRPVAFGSPGEPQHPAAADPLHHLLTALRVRRDRAVAPGQMVAPGARGSPGPPAAERVITPAALSIADTQTLTTTRSRSRAPCPGTRGPFGSVLALIAAQRPRRRRTAHRNLLEASAGAEAEEMERAGVLRRLDAAGGGSSGARPGVRRPRAAATIMRISRGVGLKTREPPPEWRGPRWASCAV